MTASSLHISRVTDHFMSPEMISLKRAGFSVLSIVTFYPVLLTRHLTSLCYFSMPTFIKFPGGNGHHIDLHSTFGIKKLDSGTPCSRANRFNTILACH